jgi:hypothetical protein
VITGYALKAYGPDSFGGFTQVICNRYPHNDQLEVIEVLQLTK